MARDFDRQVAELQVRAAILTRFTALGTPTTVAMLEIRPGSGILRAQFICATKPSSGLRSFRFSTVGRWSRYSQAASAPRVQRSAQLVN